MNSQTKKPQDPRQLLAPMDEEHFNKNRRSARDHYGEDYMEKLFKVTGGRVIYDYEEFNKRK